MLCAAASDKNKLGQCATPLSSTFLALLGAAANSSRAALWRSRDSVCHYYSICKICQNMRNALSDDFSHSSPPALYPTGYFTPQPFTAPIFGALCARHLPHPHTRQMIKSLEHTTLSTMRGCVERSSYTSLRCAGNRSGYLSILT